MKLSNSQWKDFVRTRVLRDKSNLIKDHHNLRLAAKVCLKRIPLDNKLLTRVRVNVQRLSLKSSPVLRPLVVHLVREDFSGMAPSKNGRKKGTKGSESKSETRRYGGTKTEDKENKVDKESKNQQHPRTQRKRSVHNYLRLSTDGFQTNESEISEVESSTINGATQQIEKRCYPFRKPTVHNYTLSDTRFNIENIQATTESKHQNNLPNTINREQIRTLRNRLCLSPAVAEIGERELAGNNINSECLSNKSIRNNCTEAGIFSCVSSTPVTKSTKLATSENMFREGRGKDTKHVQSGREKTLKVQTSLKQYVSTEDQTNQLDKVDKEKNVCQTNSHSQDEKPGDEIWKRPVRTRKINYCCLSDSFASDSDKELQDRPKKRIPVYRQIAPQNRALKNKDPFEFVTEPTKSKRTRDSDSDCSFFDASMHKVLQKLRGKFENKKKAVKPSHKKAGTNQMPTKKVVFHDMPKALFKVGKQIPVGKPMVNATRNVVEIGKQKPTAKLAAINEGGAKVGGVQVGKTTTRQNDNYSETGAVRIVSNILITEANTNKPPPVDILSLPDKESHPSESPQLLTAIDDCHSDISLPELSLDSVQDTGTKSNNGTPWRTDSLTGVASLPIRKHNSLPSYCQDAIFKATEIKKLYTSRSSKNLTSAKRTMQTPITNYVETDSVFDADPVLEESLFDANRFSPIKNNAIASTPNCNKTVKRKVFAPIICNEQDLTETSESPISSLSRELSDIEETTNACNLENCFGFDSSEGVVALPKRKEKAVMTYPARVSLRQVKKVFFSDHPQVGDVQAPAKLHSSIPETDSELPVALFDDPEEHFALCEERIFEKDKLEKGRRKNKKSKKKKKKDALTIKEQTELNEWAAQCNSMFEKIDEFQLETD